MAIFGRKRSSMRRQAAPVAQQRAVVAQTKAPVAQRTGIAPAPAKTYNEIQLAELRKADQTLGNVPKSTYSPADIARLQQEQYKKMLQQPQQPQQASGLRAVAPAPAQRMPGAPVAPSGAAQAAAFNQSQQAAMKQFQGQQAAFNAANRAAPATPQQNIASLQAAKVAATKQAAPRTLAPTGASMGVPGMDFRMSKGGMTKKTGYAKGGAVMCGASMPPAQKRKK